MATPNENSEEFVPIKRFNQVYSQLKSAERSNEENRGALAAQGSLITKLDDKVRALEATKDQDTISELQSQRKKAREDDDTSAGDALGDKITDLKLQSMRKEDQSQLKQKPPKVPNTADADSAALNEFVTVNTWAQSNNSDYNKEMVTYADSARQDLLNSFPNADMSDILKEVTKRVDAEFYPAPTDPNVTRSTTKRHTKPKVVAQLTPSEELMAISMYPDLTRKEAISKVATINGGIS